MYTTHIVVIDEVTEAERDEYLQLFSHKPALPGEATSVVGDGGFGVVYRGVHKGFDEPVAIKCLKLPSKVADKDRDTLLEQLRDEGRLLLRLSRATSGIVQALDIGAVTTRCRLVSTSCVS